ncbi:MAG: hypothetical protein ACNA7W_09805 [Pseudomonadales bacterium]
MGNSALHEQLGHRFAPVLDDLEQRAAVADGIIDRSLYRILICTLWVNVVLSPEDVGLEEAQLEPLHDLLNQRIATVLGANETLTQSFRYLDSKAGEQAMAAARVSADHRDMLLYFASIILDPEGHRRWMDEIRNRPSP